MKQFPAIPVLLTLITMAACLDSGPPADDLTQQVPTTPLPTINPALPDNDDSGATQSGLLLLESFRGDVQPQAQSIFGLAGQAGDPVRIEIQVRIGKPDIILYLISSNGQILTTVDSGGPGEPEIIEEFRFPASAYYELAVESKSGEGQVDVLIFQLPIEQLTGGGVIPAFGQAVSGSIDQPSTFHTYLVNIERGQRFDISARATSGDLDLLFEIYAPDGTLLALRDDTLGFDPHFYNYMPSTSGQYSIIVTNYQQTTGTYQLQVERSQSAGQLTISRRDIISLSREVRRSEWLSFVGEAGAGFSFEARPINPTSDITLAVYDIFGNRLAFADINPPGQSELLGQVQLPYDGPYQLEIGTLTEGGEVEYAARPLRAGDIRAGGLVVIGQPALRLPVLQSGTVHAYWFEGQQGQPITIETKSLTGVLDLALGLYDPAGNLLAYHDNDRFRDAIMENFALPVTGTYYVVVSLLDDRTGEYEFRIDSSTQPQDNSDE